MEKPTAEIAQKITVQALAQLLEEKGEETSIGKIITSPNQNKLGGIFWNALLETSTGNVVVTQRSNIFNGIGLHGNLITATFQRDGKFVGANHTSTVPMHGGRHSCTVDVEAARPVLNDVYQSAFLEKNPVKFVYNVA